MKASRVTAIQDEKAKCQRCLKSGHWTADCTSAPVYKARPTRSALLKNPSLKLEVEKPTTNEILQSVAANSSSSESELSYHSSDFDFTSDDDDQAKEIIAKIDKEEADVIRKEEGAISESDFSSEEEPEAKRIKK